MNRIFFIVFFVFTSFLHAKGIEDAKTYHTNSWLQWHIAMESVNQIAWNGSERVLDIGCGDGKITAFIAEKVTHGSVLGIDISQSMIDFASSRYDQMAYPNLSFLKQNATELLFDNQFDLVVSFSSLHWILNQKQVLQVIHRSLASAGKAVLHTFGKAPMNVITVAESLICTEKWTSCFPSYTPQRVFLTKDQYFSLLEQAGFRQIQISEFLNDAPFSDRQSLICFLHPLFNFLDHLPKHLQEEFIEDVADQLIVIAGPSEDGMIHFRTCNFLAIAFK